jgi:hypothetical protein
MRALLPVVLLETLAMAQSPAGGVPFYHVPARLSPTQKVAYRKAAEAMEHFIQAQAPGGEFYGVGQDSASAIDGTLEGYSEFQPATPKSSSGRSRAIRQSRLAKRTRMGARGDQKECVLCM